MDQTLLFIIFLVLSGLVLLQMICVKVSPVKGGLFTLLRVAIEVGVIVYLYFYMQGPIDRDNEMAT